MYKVGDKFIMHSQNGYDYEIEIINANANREPDMIYACEVSGIGENEYSYFEQNGDYMFCGEEYFRSFNIKKTE